MVVVVVSVIQRQRSPNDKIQFLLIPSRLLRQLTPPSPPAMAVAVTFSSLFSLTAAITFILTLSISSHASITLNSSFDDLDDSLVYIWPLPTSFTHGAETLTVDPSLSLNAGGSTILRDAFDRYKRIIFKHQNSRVSRIELKGGAVYDVSTLKVVVDEYSEELQLGVDESYSLYVGRSDSMSILGEATIEVI